MDKIIALVLSIILVLGLFAYAILGQVSGIKDTGDQANVEQSKISRMIQDPNMVTGNTVRNYISQASSSLTVHVDNLEDDDEAYPSTSTTSVKDSAIYTMSKSYNDNGELSEVSFEQVKFSR